MSVAAPPVATRSTPRHVGVSTAAWRRFGIIAFACLNAASLGVFFVVFVGVVVLPAEPRTLVYLLVAGSFAFAVLVMGRFPHWAHLALLARRRGRA